MSKSEQKRICVQSECAVRDELRSQLDAKDKEIAICRRDYEVMYKLEQAEEKELQKYRDVLKAAKTYMSTSMGLPSEKANFYGLLAKLEGECSHAWINADNEHVKGCEICTKCKTIRATPE